MALEPGQVLDGKYRIVRLIGEGGMGAVFEGENVRIQRRVAIKVVHAAYASDSGVMARFQREAQAAGRIGNDHILEVLDLGALPDGSQYMVLEFLDGEPLSKRIERRGRMTPQELTPLLLQMLKGLGAAHGAGIFHRDLKPDNLFILKEKAGIPDFVKIIDFGISKFQPLSGEGMKMTSTGAVMGTPYYMSPEQASGSGAVDARTDLYAIGVILHEALTGRVPFDGETFNQLMFKIVLSDATPPHEMVPGLDRAFSSIVSKAMARDVGQRFQTAAEFAAAVTAWTESGAEVAPVLPPRGNAAAAEGAARQAFASASGKNPIPDGLKRTGGAAPPGNVPGGGRTGGSWATSHFNAPPPKTAVLIPAIIGGVLLAVGVGVVVTRGHGSSAAAAADSASTARSAGAPVSAPVSPTVPSARPPEAEAAPATAKSPDVLPVPAASAANAAPSAKEDATDHAASKGSKAKPAGAAVPRKKPGAAAGADEPYFGY